MSEKADRASPRSPSRKEQARQAPENDAMSKTINLMVEALQALAGQVAKVAKQQARIMKALNLEDEE